MRRIYRVLAVLAVTTLIVIAFAGSAQANPVGGRVNSSVLLDHTVTLYIDGYPDTILNATLTKFGPLNEYLFNDLTALLANAGLTDKDYNATIVMRCGYGINVNRNTTPSTAHLSWNDNGSTGFASRMELESCAADETFSKLLYEGWNLISLPLDTEDNSASAVLSTVSYDAVYSYNATSKQFESADVMDPGTCYFVNATEDCEWEYSGTPYTSIEDVSLEHGLNMVGWLNCSKDVGDALSSISGKYHYVAQWNATAQKYEVYNPAAPDPSAFNDFTTMERGAGYFISAKQECTLSESC